jgi:CRISPR/Cas system-associated exonuclease Cas4 (RecB family)
MRTAWDKTAERDDQFQGILETGTDLEPLISRIVSKAGEVGEPPFRIVGTQMPTKDNLLDRHKISGTIDGFWQVRSNGEWKTEGVVDVKTSNPNIFRNLVDYTSLANYSWTRKYRGQLMLYALAHNLEKCVILFVNKSNLYEMKIIEFDVDFAYCERLIQKADEVNLAVECEEAPDKLNSPDECPRCAFAHICLPDYTPGGNMKMVNDEELIGVLDRLRELEDEKKEIKQLEKQRDVILVKGQDVIAGQHVITWKEIHGNKKPSPGGPYSRWRKKIVFTGG